MAVITSSQYHVLIASLVFTLVMASGCLALTLGPRRRRPGQLPWRRWKRRVPRRHAAVLAVLREDYRARPGSLGLPSREIERRSGARCTRAVLRRLAETGWAERSSHPGITPWHMDRTGYRLTGAGWTGSARVPGEHLPGEVEALQDRLWEAEVPRGAHRGPLMPDGHPSAPSAVRRSPI